jgi:hypothetical protein
MKLDDITSKSAGFADSVCTCKLCDHRIASECMKTNCNCCTDTNHSMVLDGIEGFARPSSS